MNLPPPLEAAEMRQLFSVFYKGRSEEAELMAVLTEFNSWLFLRGSARYAYWMEFLLMVEALSNEGRVKMRNGNFDQLMMPNSDWSLSGGEI
jgi:hypothetical protein